MMNPVIEPRVLLVDDEVRALALAERALVSGDIACRLANSAEEALTWLRGSAQADEARVERQPEWCRPPRSRLRHDRPRVERRAIAADLE